MTTPIKDFFFEFHYSYFLSPHQMILDTYDVAFETRDFYYFAQEVGPLGDLWQVKKILRIFDLKFFFIYK